MRTLIDTQCFYWGLCDRASLSVRAEMAMGDPLRTKTLSVAVFWEMTIKAALGKLTLPKPPEVLWHEAETTGAEVLGIRPQHLTRLAILPPHHKDPFDRLMIAQALAESWEVISSDSQWDAYGVTRIW